VDENRTKIADHPSNSGFVINLSIVTELEVMKVLTVIEMRRHCQMQHRSVTDAVCSECAQCV